MLFRCPMNCWLEDLTLMTKKVLKVIVTHLRTRNTGNTFAGRAPEYSIGADVRILPAVMLPIKGWLSQKHVFLQCVQNCVMRKKETVMAFFTFTDELLQIRHVRKSINRADSNTK